MTKYGPSNIKDAYDLFLVTGNDDLIDFYIGLYRFASWSSSCE